MNCLALVGLVVYATLAAAHGPHDRPLVYLQEVQWPALPEVSIVAKDIRYSIDNASFLGYAAYPARAREPLPGVLIVPAWMGLGETEKFRAREMASHGYVAFALDVYGEGLNPSNITQAMAASAALLADPATLHLRLLTALDVLKNLGEGPVVVNNTLTANGYCLGGLAVLELARLNTPGLVAVSAFHPNLRILTNATAITARVTVHYPDLDAQGDNGLLAFEAEMTALNATWTSIKYGNMFHGWTDPQSSIYSAREAAFAHDTMRALYNTQVSTAPYTYPATSSSSSSDELSGAEKAVVVLAVFLFVAVVAIVVLLVKSRDSGHIRANDFASSSTSH